jgi:hypothetical protein
LKRSKAMAAACMVCYPGRRIKTLPQYDKKTSAEFNLISLSDPQNPTGWLAQGYCA